MSEDSTVGSGGLSSTTFLGPFCDGATFLFGILCLTTPFPSRWTDLGFVSVFAWVVGATFRGGAFARCLGVTGSTGGAGAGVSGIFIFQLLMSGCGCGSLGRGAGALLSGGGSSGGDRLRGGSGGPPIGGI